MVDIYMRRLTSQLYSVAKSRHKNFLLRTNIKPLIRWVINFKCQRDKEKVRGVLSCNCENLTHFPACQTI
jgi:hypothetical protein